jgi:hypothetical protein
LHLCCTSQFEQVLENKVAEKQTQSRQNNVTNVTVVSVCVLVVFLWEICIVFQTLFFVAKEGLEGKFFSKVFGGSSFEENDENSVSVSEISAGFEACEWRFKGTGGIVVGFEQTFACKD